MKIKFLQKKRQPSFAKQVSLLVKEASSDLDLRDEKHLKSNKLILESAVEKLKFQAIYSIVFSLMSTLFTLSLSVMPVEIKYFMIFFFMASFLYLAVAIKDMAEAYHSAILLIKLIEEELQSRTKEQNKLENLKQLRITRLQSKYIK